VEVAIFSALQCGKLGRIIETVKRRGQFAVILASLEMPIGQIDQLERNIAPLS
jgi:hypothetical protein